LQLSTLTLEPGSEILTNIHSFAIVVPNHAGEDIYRFETPVKVKSDEFYLRVVIGSANFKTGLDANDFMHGWLNYQIEHHMFPYFSWLFCGVWVWVGGGGGGGGFGVGGVA